MQLSANKIFRTIAADPDNYGEGNYALYGELRVEQSPGSGIFTKTLTAFLTPDVADLATFELQDGLADFFPLPDFNPFATIGMEVITDNQVRAQFYSAEAYGSPRALVGLTLRDTFKALNGGLPKEISEEFFTEILPVSKQFLTWHPLRKRVTTDQPELLHFAVYSEAITALNLILKVYFSDGTDATETVETLAEVEVDEIIRIPAGYLTLGVGVVNAEKLVKKYEVWLTDQTDTIISEIRTYVVEYVSTPGTRFWMFTNSLGMWEILRAEGKKSETLEVTRESSSGYLPQGYDRTLGELRQRITGSTEEIEVSSGYFDSKEEAIWGKEIMLTEKLYLLTINTRIPYQITSNQYRVYQDQDHRYFLRFTAQLAYNNTKTSTK